MLRHRRQRFSAATTPEKVFGRVLQAIRKERGFSQERLAFESGYHPTYISQIERGVKNPSLRTVLSLASVLSVPASAIVRRVEARLGKGWRPDRESTASE